MFDDLKLTLTERSVVVCVESENTSKTSGSI